MNTRTNNNVLRRCRGFSLAEVAIAIAIAGLGLTSVVGLVPTLLDSDRVSGFSTAMPQLAAQAMGRLKTEPYPATFPTTGVMYFSETCQVTTETATGVAAPVYRCNYTLDAIPASGPGGNVSIGNNICNVQLEMRYQSAPNSPPRLFHATLAKP